MTRREMCRAEMTRDPIFLLQSRTHKRSEWTTETVFLSREEAQRFGDKHTYRWNCWRVYFIPASGELAELLRRLDPDGERMSGRTFD
jgi:hypothetical protein